MRRMTARLGTLGLCVALLLQPLPASAEATLTASTAVRSQAGVIVSGERAMVDFAWLQSVNADSVAWLYQEETRLSEPILQGVNNEYYLKRGFDRNLVGLKGVAFLDSEQSPELDEPLVKIYGSAREGGRLESMLSYAEQSYYEAHPSFRLLTPSTDYQADIFACILTVENQVEQWCGQAEGESFSAWLSRIQAASAINALPDALPDEGEKLAAVTLVRGGENRRVVLASLRPIAYDTHTSVDLNKVAFDQLPTDSGYRQVGTLGEMMVYAQNDRLWGDMRYESELTSKYRKFSGGGCGPTAVAMLIANLVSMEELPQIRDFSLDGTATLFCPCSVNRVYCSHLHAPYHLETAQDYLRYLPVVIADFAAGNNRWKINSRPPNSRGSNMRFMDALCEVYGLTKIEFENAAAVIDYLAETGNRGLVLCCAFRGSAFTTTSHYMVMAGVDDTYFYMLDPLFRDDYSATDVYGVIEEIIAPGVVKIRRDNVRKTGLDIVGYYEKAQN